ncbi:MAG: helix-hairpin-helix domain-containing protein [Gammaproteobacteria bacterium]|nr:helix-hairpin-helix domain-containing protein [Gammaproteobacteria bacterium]
MQLHHDDLYQDRTWFDVLGVWLAQQGRRWLPRRPARLWSTGFALFAALCVAWAAGLATQCVLVELPAQVCLAQWLAAGLLLVAARHFLAVTGLSAASTIEPHQRIERRVETVPRSADIPSMPSTCSPSTRQSISGDAQQFFLAVKTAGINLRIAQALYAAGFRTAEQVRTAADAALLATPGIGPATVRKLRMQFGQPHALPHALYETHAATHSPTHSRAA